jgi:D-alanyl-D-alanine carboxypeptidase
MGSLFLPKDKTMPLKIQRFLTVVIVLPLLILALGASDAEAARKTRHHAYRAPPDRFAEIVIEASTGYVISEKNADKRLYPASLTKMMTLYLTFDALSQGTLSRYQYIPVSKRAASQEPSSLGLRTGDTIRVEDAILAIATKSANDCAVALAEAVGGSEERFARAMVAKARQLGMNNTSFVNASGLHNRSQFSTARDMALLSRALIHDYPRYYHYFSTASFTYGDYTYLNHNKLMGNYQGMDGLKTGYVYASGFNLAASAVRNNTRLIGVVFGGRTARTRNIAMARYLNEGFARISDVRVASLAEKKPNQSVPVRRAAPLQNAPEVVADNSFTARAPQLDAKGAVIDQGDTDVSDDVKPQPQAANNGKGGAWAIQIGIFPNRDAGMKALQKAKKALPAALRGTDHITPHITRNGLIYHANLSGLARNDAKQACHILKGSCQVLTTVE